MASMTLSIRVQNACLRRVVDSYNSFVNDYARVSFTRGPIAAGVETGSGRRVLSSIVVVN